MYIRRNGRIHAHLVATIWSSSVPALRVWSRLKERRTENKKRVELVSEDHRTTVVVDEILIGAGRAPNVEGMNLETAGVEYNTERGVVVDDFLQTSNPQIYAAGDACLEHKFTHTADASARIVVQNALFLGRAAKSFPH